jgi:uncharacterized oligopeptide transporter (OPT) family protein
LIIGLIFGSLVAMANAFLMLTIPVMITAAMISVAALFAYTAFVKEPPPSGKEAVISYTVHKAASYAFSIFPVVWVFLIAYNIPKRFSLSIPDWIIPDPTLYEDVLQTGTILSRSWATPLAWMIPVGIVSGIGALMVVIWLRDHFIHQENLRFPEAEADIQFIKSITDEKFRFDYLFYGLTLGFFFDFIFIRYPSSLGAAPDWMRELAYRLNLVDFTPYVGRVLPGAVLCIVVSFGLVGLGMLMSPKSTFNMVGSALLFYVVLGAILVSRETIQASRSFTTQWSAFRYPYGLSLSVGILLTAVLAPLVLKMASPLISGSKWKWKPPKETVAVFAVFCAAVFVLSLVLSMDRFMTVFPLSSGKALLVGAVMLAVFVVGILINTHIAGEAGLSWMTQFAEITDFLRRGIVIGVGALGFEGFAITESLKGARFAAGQVEALKVGQSFEVKPKHQYISGIFGWCFGWLISTPFVFLIWHFYGVGTGALPMLNVQATAMMMAAFSGGEWEIIFNNWFLLAGFIIGVVVFFLQKRNLPFVVTAFGIGVFVGPYYVTTFLVGAVIRMVIERIKGTTWMEEKGKPFSAGLVLGGLALAPLLMVVVNILVLAFGGG